MKLYHFIYVFFFCVNSVYAIPSDFVYLRDLDSTIQQDIRYAGFHNFIGRPITGYQATECILVKQAATALIRVQKELRNYSLSLKVYDCYRPTQAVNDFISWSQQPQHQEMKNEFYPHVDKADVFLLGYIAAKSGHSRGSTMDLTIVPIPAPKEESYHAGQKLIACTASYKQRYHDNSIDMGTGFDCLDELAHFDNQSINKISQQNRVALRQMMMRHGFVPYDKEWWHFTLKNEPYPDNYFNFPIEQKSGVSP